MINSNAAAVAATRPSGANNRVDATFDGVTITFYSYACNVYSVYVEAMEQFHAKGLTGATVNNIRLSVR